MLTIKIVILILCVSFTVSSPAGLDCLDKGLRVKIGGPDACEVTPHSKPWIVGLYYLTPGARRKDIQCGGTLIAKNIVLTAAHCICDVYGSDASECVRNKLWNRDQLSYITVGDHDDTRPDAGEKKIKISKFIPFDRYDGKIPDFGILVLEENVDVENNRYVKIAHLPWPNEKPPTGKRLVVSGWGSDYNDRNRKTDRLWAAMQEILPRESCGISDRENKYVLCVGDSTQPKNSACFGDSGGPLTFTDRLGDTIVYGVVQSGGGEGAVCLSTAKFARVSEPSVLRWIKKQIEIYQ